MPKLKVYFACSIRGGGDTSSYEAIVDAIKHSNAECLSEVFVGDAINTQGSPMPDTDIYKRDTSWIQECDLVIAEVTNPSLGVGYEIAYAEQLNKPILALYKLGTNLSAMISGNPQITTKDYDTQDTLTDAITACIQGQSLTED